MALHNSGGIAELPVAVTDLANSLNSIAAMSGMKYCHIPPHATPYDAGGGSGGGPGVSQLIPYPATVNGVMSFPAPRGPLQSPAVFSQMQTASGPPTAAAAASPAGGNGGADLTSFNTAVVGGPTGPGNTAPPNGLESPHSSVTGATTMVLSQSSARGVHLMQQQFPPPQRIVQASATMIESGYYVSPCWAPAGQPAPPQQQQQQFDETGQLVGLNASAVSNCGPGMPTTNRRIVQQPPPIPNPGLAAPPTATLDPRYVPPNLPHASPHPMYHSVNNICIPPTQPTYLMHDAGAPLNHDLANFGPLGPPGLSPTSGQPRLFMSSAAAQSAAQFRLSMDPRSAVAALHLRPSGAACCFPVSGVGNNVSGAGAGGPMPTVDPSGLRPPFGSESLVSTPPRKAAEPRKKRAKATKNPAGKQRNTARTNRGATAAAAAAAQATAAAAASVQKRLSESEAPRVTPPPPQPPPPSSSLIGSPVMLTSQSSMPLPTSKPSPPMGGDWMRINSRVRLQRLFLNAAFMALAVSWAPSRPPPFCRLESWDVVARLGPYTSVAPPVNYLSANGTAACNTPSDACPPPVQLINAHAATAAAPVPVSTSSTEERLVCPITNGNLWGPAVLEMDEEQSHRSPNGLQVRSFEFEINADYLDTIVKRLDLDIVVCSHLSSEPLQVCHWPDEAVNIRFNGTLLNLDRSTSVDGQPAHKVCCVKNLCRAGRNTLEFILSARNGLSMSANPNFQAPSGNTGVGSGLKSHEFAAFMVHMPAFNALLEGLQRRQPAAPSLLCQLILSSWNSRHPSSPLDPNQPSIQPVIAEISLICPVFRTRMQVPGRIVGCQHVDMFDMEAYLHREAVWPRLACPICGVVLSLLLLDLRYSVLPPDLYYSRARRTNFDLLLSCRLVFDPSEDDRCRAQVTFVHL
nr:unnamed protein product [Spirometra erinaceieuropaei]